MPSSKLSVRRITPVRPHVCHPPPPPPPKPDEAPPWSPPLLIAYKAHAQFEMMGMWWHDNWTYNLAPVPGFPGMYYGEGLSENSKKSTTSLQITETDAPYFDFWGYYDHAFFTDIFVHSPDITIDTSQSTTYHAPPWMHPPDYGTLDAEIYF